MIKTFRIVLCFLVVSSCRHSIDQETGNKSQLLGTSVNAWSCFQKSTPGKSDEFLFHLDFETMWVCWDWDVESSGHCKVRDNFQRYKSFGWITNVSSENVTLDDGSIVRTSLVAIEDSVHKEIERTVRMFDVGIAGLRGKNLVHADLEMFEGWYGLESPKPTVDPTAPLKVNEVYCKHY